VSSSETRAIAALLLISALLGGCEIEKATIAQTKPRIALHAVLSATAPAQVLLLERTRSGAVTVIAPPFELEDPFGPGTGIAEAGATALLAMPNGTVLVGREDPTPGGAGSGIYRFALPGSLLERNASYRLLVTTSAGEVLTAETVVPGGTAEASAEQRDFDRSAEQLDLEWPAAPGARSYLVRVETPFGPRSFFTMATSVRLTGDLRNPDITSIPHVFIPGFPQAVTVSAVDSNFYDWYRTHNDEISGTGLINRVHGGLGVFGSLVRLRLENLRVVGPQADRESGTFGLIGTPAEQSVAPYLTLELYVESRAARADQDDALSGRYGRVMRLGDVGCAVCGLLGSAKNGNVELVFLRDWFASDTVEVFRGQLRGDTIVGQYRTHAGTARFVRAR
jgi:hypothetical protein